MSNLKTLFSNKQIYLLLYILLAMVYVSGTFIPLMENDAAQHAFMAMRMYLKNDYVSLMRGYDAYLDKPHMHFWLAAFSYTIFGLNQWAYRIPALLFTAIGAFSCFKLTKSLYHKDFAHFGSLIFLSSQAIILANHDVRTDAVLTGAVIFAIWQLYEFVRNEKMLSLLLGSVAAGITFSTKGWFGVGVIGIALLCHIAYTKRWRILYNPKILLGIVIFALTISPTLYAYYLQYDMHPEVMVKGRSNIEGVKFILWDQNFDRFSSTGFQKQNPDYFFFFHTLLWVFLPWSIIAYSGIFNGIKNLVREKFRYNGNMEVLTLGGFLVTLILISFSQFKLPHYLNPILPILSVLTAGYLYKLTLGKNDKTLRIFLYIQYGVCVIGLLAVVGLFGFTFGSPKVLTIIVCSAFFLLLLYFVFRGSFSSVAKKILVVSVTFMVFLNFSLNTYYYPHLLKYQSGGQIAVAVNEGEIDKEKIYILDKEYRWSLDFYTKHIIPSMTIEETTHIKDEVFVVTTKKEKVDTLRTLKNITVEEKMVVPRFRITKVSAKFLNPSRRASQLDTAYVLKLKPKRIN
ncbi:ArnT family glycosyltransferase [Galbibacter mesophilus]|uniref:ArnT family glycosyltransferase n=1 Tax=Galbibacter mesophilus TaxID=379069 RepID=UPI00191D36FA|nr:glycosyltransferase family 39 protein [Galbibacter mesophilus]MCM5664165.1 glycosyltransferase family 39 protein [Galbibacter mesophilus]